MQGDAKQTLTLIATEGWAWLENQGLLIAAFDAGPSMRTLSREGLRLAARTRAADPTATRLLPKKSLHLSIRDDVWSHFHRGKFDAAVFEAMKAVEVAVREAGGFGPTDIGSALMRRAADPQEAVEILMLANHLLRIVDGRR